MGTDLTSMLKNRAINGWRLFWLISIPMSIAMVAATLRSDLSTGSGVSTMIQFSVRWAVPFIYLVVAASAIHVLLPGAFSAWMLRNRKYIGMCFAVAMAWQGSFIFMMSNFFREYYFEEVYLLRDELEGSIGYIFLPVMVLTSFQFVRRHLTSKQWKLIHTTGIYFLWAYPFSVYWWNLSYYKGPLPIDYIFYWGGFLAMVLRIAAWGKKRRQSASKVSPDNSPSLVSLVAGGVLIACGIGASATGLHWQEPVTALLTSVQWSADLVLWFPFWPFEPYLPLVVIALGTWLMTHTWASSNPSNLE